jgi:hypothetical protein
MGITTSGPARFPRLVLDDGTIVTTLVPTGISVSDGTFAILISDELVNEADGATLTVLGQRGGPGTGGAPSGDGGDLDVIAGSAGPDGGGGVGAVGKLNLGKVGVDNAAIQIDGVTGANQLGVRVRSDDTIMERITIGANDSGGAGFRVLRIPN